MAKIYKTQIGNFICETSTQGRMSVRIRRGTTICKLDKRTEEARLNGSTSYTARFPLDVMAHRSAEVGADNVYVWCDKNEPNVLYWAEGVI